MSAAWKKRKSCEACRARKLKCSGKDTGCSRCVHLGLVCKFHDKGRPGRPRKWAQVEPRMQNSHQDTTATTTRDGQASHDAWLSENADLQQQSHHTPSTVHAESSAACSTDLLSNVPQEWTPFDDLSALPLLDFNDSEQLNSLPLDSFRACLSNNAHDRDPAAAADLSSNASVTSAAAPQVCDCAKQVFDVMRSLKRNPISHSTIRTLRLGTELFSKLLTCPICYDVSKPPRITLQNVLLLGRLVLEVTAGYQKYLKWLKEYCASLEESKLGDTVYLNPGDHVSSAVGLAVSSDKFYELIAHGLQTDAGRLSDLGSQFAIRQHNRHLIGHEACPDPEGRCWREKDDIDPDPSDVCPQSPAARLLTPCYRIVDEVRSKIKQLEDSIT